MNERLIITVLRIAIGWQVPFSNSCHRLPEYDRVDDDRSCPFYRAVQQCGVANCSRSSYPLC